MAQDTTLRIGELATRSGLTPDALRYYERVGLMPRARRTVGGFRVYGADVIDRLHFIKQAQANGLTLAEIRELLGFRDRGGRERCRQVQRLLTRKLDELEGRLVQLEAFKRTLQGYLGDCERAQRQSTDECPVVEQLGGRHP